MTTGPWSIVFVLKALFSNMHMYESIRQHTTVTQKLETVQFRASIQQSCCCS